MAIVQTPLARVVDAIAFAADAHRDQRRKDEALTPYINHPVALVRVLAVEAGVEDPDVLCAAALHDYLEDCCGGEGQPSVEQGWAILEQRFGATVLAYVEAVTDDKSLPQGRAQAPPGRARRAHPARRAAGEAGRQDLQPARHRRHPACRLGPATPPRILRLGAIRRRPHPRHPSGA